MTKDSGQSTTAVQVALRIRPLTERDRAQPRFANLANDDVLKIHNKTVQVVPQNKLFTFDHVFGTTSTQEEIFSTIGDNLIRKFIEGYNVTILAYGQTSSGKTYTMGTAAHGSATNPANEGIVPRSMALLFELLHNDSSTRPISPTSSISSSTTTSNKSASRLRPKSRIANRSTHVPNVNNNSHKPRYTIKVSFIEIYNEDLHDLLNSAPPDEVPPINIREDTKGRIYWTGVKEVIVHSTDDVLYYLEQGTQNRATGATDMNEKSSRSHAIFSVSLKQEKWVPSDVPKKTTRPASASSNTRSSSRLSNNVQGDEGEWLITTSKFHFVDLAGSERLKRTAAEGDRRKEGININAGLLALGNVISALGDPSKKNAHVPYRDSKLTRLLQDSLGGSATTLMIACASPVEYNLAETQNTLQYANRARNIKNRSEKNQVEEWMTTENIELLRSLIGKLKNELSYLKAHHKSTPQPLNDDLFDDSSTVSSSTPSMDELYQEQRAHIADLQRQVEELGGEAAVTRERNKMVEKELSRLRLIESMAQAKQEQVDFQHLVEPVIEEYEKSVAKLESQLAMTRAALNHSDIGVEEQQNKVLQLESVARAQEQTISDLQSRLTKLLEREQSNDSYIHELENKLMKSAQDASRDQEMLNELKNRIMKLKETDENTEQYIFTLEQRLAAADAERTRLVDLVEELEAKVEARERKHMEVLKKFSKQSTETSSTEKLILKELDEVNAKYSELVKEKDALELKIETLQKDSHRQTVAASKEAESLEEDLDKRGLSMPSPGSAGKNSNSNRKSFANENETASSVAALTLLQTKKQLEEETKRANHLQDTLNRLKYDHEETTKELNEVLQRHHETLEQLDFLESSAARSEDLAKSLDLNKEIAKAKDIQEKEELQNQIDELTHKVQSLQKKIAIKDSELEMANDSINKLEHQLIQKDNQAAADMNLDEDYLKKVLAQEKEQSSHWKLAHRELKQDMDKMTLDLDEKEQYISQLKEKLASSNDHDLQTKLEESNQEVVSLQKRLAETLGSLTKLKIAHDGLQKKLQQETDPLEDASFVDSGFNKERDELLEKHKIELDSVQKDMDAKLTAINQVLDETTSEKETAFQKLATLEAELKSQIKTAQETHLLDQERLIEEHNAELLKLNQSFESTSMDLKNQISKLQQEIDTSDLFHESLIKEHEEQLSQLQAAFEKDSRVLLDKISDLEQELDESKTLYAQAVTEHESEVLDLSKNFEKATHALEDQILELESELEASKDLHDEILASYNERIRDVANSTQEEEQKRSQEIQSKLQQRLEDLQLELKELKDSQQGILDQHADHIASVTTEHDSLSQKLAKDMEVLKVSLESAETNHSDTIAKLTTDHQQALDLLQTQLNEATTGHLDTVSQLTTDHQQELQHLQSRLKDAETAHLDALSKITADHKQELDRLQSRLDSSETSQSDLLSQLTADYKNAEQQLELLQSQLKDTEASHLHALDQLKQEHQEALGLLQSQVNDAKTSHAQLTADHQQELELLHSRLKSIESSHSEQLGKVNDDYERAKQQLDDLVLKNADATEQIETLKSELKEKAVAYAEQVSQMKEENQKTVQLLESQIQELQHKRRNSNLKEAELHKVEKVQGELDDSKSENLKESRPRSPSPKVNTGLAGRIKMLESHSKTDLSIKDTSNSFKNQIAKLQEKLEEEQQKTAALGDQVSVLSNKEDEMVVQHEEMLIQIKAQYEKELEIQLSSIEEMAQEHEEELAQQKKELTDAYETRISQLNDELARQHVQEVENKQQVTEHHVNEKANDKAETRIAELEDQVKQIQEENLEYSALSGELEKEMARITSEMDTLADDLEKNEDIINQVKSTLGVSEEGAILKKIHELVNEQSKMSNKLAEAQLAKQLKPSESDNSSYQKEIQELQKKLSDQQAESESLEQQYKRQVDEQKEKLEQSELARKKLEKQLEDFLTKKSSFLCF